MMKKFSIKLALLLIGMGASLPSFSVNDGMKSWGGAIEGFPQCYQYKVVGVCGFPPKGFVVNHFLPKAYIEVIKKTGDSVFKGGKGGNAEGSSVVPPGSTGPEHWTMHEVRIWHIDDLLRTKLTYNLSNCALCKDAHAGNPATEFIESGGENLDQSIEKELGLGGILDKASCVASAGGIDQFLSKYLNNQLGQLTKLLYDSAADKTAWRTGCRDISIVFKKMPEIAKECFLGFGSGQANETPSETAAVPNNLDKIGKESPCLGPWGSKFPRTGWNIGLSSEVGAAMAAYKGMHNAAYEMETYGCPVGDSQMMQPVYPEFGKCFAVGAPIREVEKQIAHSNDGRYGFFWWTPVTCCIPFSQYTSCTG